jgi:hypothetical protein
MRPERASTKNKGSVTMVRKALLGLLGCTLIAGAALAQESPVDVTVSSSVTSTYMWNGFNRVEMSGLDNGPAIQPGVAVGVKGTGLAVKVGGSFVVNDDSELHETTYGVGFQRSVSPLVEVGGGYTYYDNRVKTTVTPGVEVDGEDNHEVWGGVVLSSAVGVKPGVTVKYEKPTTDGADGFAVVVGSLGYAMPLSGVNVGGVGVTLDWSTGVVYNSGITVGNVDVLKSGVTAWQVGVSSALHAGRVVVTPAVNYQVSTYEVPTVTGVQDADNEFWASVGVAYGF